MQIAICDDEVSMVQILEKKIKKLLPDAVIDKYLSGDELIASGSKPDILFLDIQMPGETLCDVSDIGSGCDRKHARGSSNGNCRDSSGCSR